METAAQIHANKKQMLTVLAKDLVLALFAETELRTDLKLVMIVTLCHLMDVLLNVRLNLSIPVLLKELIHAISVETVKLFLLSDVTTEI